MRRSSPDSDASTSSSRAEAVADTANRVFSGIRQLHLAQRPFVAAPVTVPYGSFVAVSVSTRAGDDRLLTLRCCRSSPRVG